MHEFYTSVDFRNHVLKNTRLELFSSNPATPLEGRIWHNSDEKIPYIRANSLDLPLVAKDDNFHNGALITTNEGSDELLVWDSSATPSYQFDRYRRITFSNFKAQFGTASNAFKTLTANSGSAIIATGEDTVSIHGDNTILSTRNVPAEKRMYLDFKTQVQKRFLAGPSSGVDAAPTFRQLLLSDLPAGITIDWTNVINKPSTFPPSSHSHPYEPELGNPSIDGYVLSSTIAGVRSWIAMSAGTLISFGTEGQIPYTNSTVDDFNYSSKFSWNNTTGVLTLSNKIQAPADTDLIIKAGDKNVGTVGKLYLSPGTEVGFNPNVYFGDPTYDKAGITLSPAGTQADISLNISPKGYGGMSIGGILGDTLVYGNVFGLMSASVQVGYSSLGTVTFAGGPGTSVDVHGTNVVFKGGNAWSTGNNNGGSFYLHGGDPNGSGSRGNVYFGDGSNGYLPAKSAETNVVYYDTATGKLSYGTVSGGSGSFVLFEQLYNSNYQSNYKEIVYTGSDVTGVNVWTDSSKTTKLFTKTISYDIAGNVEEVVIVDEINSETLTIEYTYDMSGNVDTITSTKT